MTANPLKQAGGTAVRCKFSAWEYARFARENGDMKKAELWEDAARTGWDDIHHFPEA